MTELVKNYAEYDAFLQGHPKGHFGQSAQWARQKPDWEWQAVISRDEAGEIRGSMALMFRRLPLIGGTLAYCCRGPVCDYRDTETLTELCRAAKELAENRRAVALRIDPDIPAEQRELVGALQRQGFRSKRGRNGDQIQPKFVYRLPLEGKTEEDLMAGFRPKTRYNIRLAQRCGVEVRVCGEEAVPAFSALMEVTGKRDGFVTRPASYFSALLRNMGSRARLYMAFYQDVPLAGAIAVCYGDKTWYLYGASGNDHREKMPNYLLQWEMIRWALQNGSRLYDFRGVSGSFGENAPLSGLCRFKAGFGGVLTEFPDEMDLVLRPAAYPLMRWALALRGRIHRR